MVSLLDDEKMFNDMFSHVDNISARDRQTDRCTDGHLAAA